MTIKIMSGVLNGMLNTVKSKTHILIEEYYSYIYSVAFSYTKDTESAKDLTQDTIMALITKYVCGIKEEEIISPMTKSLIYIVVRNKSLDYLKAAKRKIGSLDIENYDFYEALRENNSPDAIYEHNELVNTIATKLPLSQSDAIILKHIHNLDNKTCSEILNIKPSAFEKRLQRAKKTLEKFLRAEGYYE